MANEFPQILSTLADDVRRAFDDATFELTMEEKDPAFSYEDTYHLRIRVDSTDNNELEHFSNLLACYRNNEETRESIWYFPHEGNLELTYSAWVHEVNWAAPKPKPAVVRPDNFDHNCF